MIANVNILLLSASEWEAQRFQLLRFVRRHGERRISGAAWRKLLKAGAAELGEPGAAIAVAYTQSGCPAGIAYAESFGDGACLVAVHSALRGRGIGRRLLDALANRWGKLVCRVALDNPASLAMCFAAGFVGVGLESGPTGKPTLRLQRLAGDGLQRLAGGAPLAAADGPAGPGVPAAPAGR